ncbi:MAG: SCO family protein [Candidatus Methylomirabilales bacterium]
MKPQAGLVRPWDLTLQRLLWSALHLVLAGVVVAGTWSLLRGGLAGRMPGAGASPGLPVYGSVPEFSLTERSGRQVRGSDLRGKVWIANFIYTHCPDTCPLQSGQIARLQADLAAEGDVRLVSITVDPERDTPEVLSRYADRFGAAPDRWIFLTGEKEAIHRLAREAFRVGVVEPGEVGESPLDEAFPPPRLPDREARGRVGTRIFSQASALAHPGHAVQLVMHSSRFVLVDRVSRIRGYYESTDGESLRRLRQHVRALLRET